jgi:hypothetical protein
MDAQRLLAGTLETGAEADGAVDQASVLLEVIVQRAVRVISRPEVVQFAANLLAPDARRVSGEGEVGIGLGRLAGGGGRVRIRLRHADCPLNRVSL